MQFYHVQLCYVPPAPQTGCISHLLGEMRESQNPRHKRRWAQITARRRQPSVPLRAHRPSSRVCLRQCPPMSIQRVPGDHTPSRSNLSLQTHGRCSFSLPWRSTTCGTPCRPVGLASPLILIRAVAPRRLMHVSLDRRHRAGERHLGSCQDTDGDPGTDERVPELV